jgi:Na+/proline symporter
MTTKAQPTEILDSLLHPDLKRVIVGGICGLAAGCVMLLLSSFFTTDGASKLWWLQMAASICFGGQASSFDASKSVFIDGALWHFGISLFLGLLFGKMTTSKSFTRLAIYGLVLGGFCWLASNMFAPDFFDIVALGSVKEWTRMFLFQSFTLSMAFFLSIAVRL